MASALRPGRPNRFYPSKTRSSKLPECAGIYYIYDADGNIVYTGQAVNLRRRVYQHKRNGKIPADGYVDCFMAKEGISYDELDATEREKISKYNPPLNQRNGGGGRKSKKINRHSMPTDLEQEPIQNKEKECKNNRNPLYKILGYEKVNKSGYVLYIKEPKSVIFMLIEIMVKACFLIIFLLTILGVYLRISKGVVLNQYMLIGMIVIPIFCLVLFHYIRSNKAFTLIGCISVILGVALYLSSYSIPVMFLF